MNNKLNDFLRIIRNCRYTNTYKMVWARSIVKIIEKAEVDSSAETLTISFKQISECFFRYYWNISEKCYVEQGPSGLKKPIIYSIVFDTLCKYHHNNNDKFDYYNMAIQKFDEYDINYEDLLKHIEEILKHDVSYRFLILNNEIIKIYDYKKGNNYLIIDKDMINDIKSHSESIINFIDKRWLLSLEKFNSLITKTELEYLIKNVEK